MAEKSGSEIVCLQMAYIPVGIVVVPIATDVFKQHEHNCQHLSIRFSLFCVLHHFQ